MFYQFLFGSAEYWHFQEILDADPKVTSEVFRFFCKTALIYRVHSNVTFSNKSKENLLPKVIWFSIDYSIKLKIGVRLLYLVFSCRRVIQNVFPLGEPLEIRFNSKSIRILLWCYILDILEYLLSPSCFEFRPTWNN